MFNSKIKALIFGFLFSVLMSMISFSSKCENISNKILRLHILANSNSCEDQNLKLKVKDEIIKKFGSGLKVCCGFEEAARNAESKIDQIKEFAQKIVYENGFDYKVNAEITDMFFNIRDYKNVSLPAGVYKALRITIGEAKGKNWWCVMFPPMCLPAAEEKNELSEVLSPEEIDIVENKNEYIIKFKALEFFLKIENGLEDLRNYIKENFEKIREKYEIKFKLLEIISDITSYLKSFEECDRL